LKRRVWGATSRSASLAIEAATLHAVRDAAGHANWQLNNPDYSTPQACHIILRFP